MNDTTTDRAKAHAEAQRRAKAAERHAEEAERQAAEAKHRAAEAKQYAEETKAVLAQYHGEPVAVRRCAGDALKAAFKELRRDGYRCTMGEPTSDKKSDFYLWSTNEQARRFREEYYRPNDYYGSYHLYHGSDAHGSHSTEYLSKLAHAVAVLKKHGLPVDGPASVGRAIKIEADSETTVFALLPTV